MTTPRPAIERFMAKVERIPFCTCWLWVGASSRGYGNFGILERSGVPMKVVLAHRWIWTYTNGPIPEGMDVLHNCDNPSCVNPAHLFLGTHQDNMSDMIAKGRSRKSSGEKNGNSKLTDALAAQILSETGKHRDIAKRYGVCQYTVSAIKRGEAWRHVSTL